MQNAKLRPEFAPLTSAFDILHTSFAPEPAVWWPIRNQILVPFTALLLVAVTLTAVTAAVDAARRSERATVAQLNQVINTLGRSNFPFSQGVLNQMRGLSGAEFAVFDTDGLRVSTLSDALAASIDPAVLRGGIATQGVPCVTKAPHHQLPSREKLAKVTLGRRAAAFSAACRTDRARPSSSRERYSTVRPSKVTRVVPPVYAAARAAARLPAGCASAQARTAGSITPPGGSEAASPRCPDRTDHSAGSA